MKYAKYRNYVYLSVIFINIHLIFGCKKNEESQDSGIVINEIHPQVDNTADSLAIVDYIDCGNISIGGDYNYDENGKIYYQYGTSRYTSDGRFVYLSEDGEEIGTLECGEEHIENDNSNFSDSNNIETQKQWVNCKHCHGTGYWKCTQCDGTGKLEFQSCNYCGRDGCSKCDWTGNNKCFYCEGKGNNGDCPKCEGRGQVLMEY